MLNTTDSITIEAALSRVFGLAVEVERWPELLPHYRYVRKIASGDSGSAGRFAMGARRSRIPVRWTADQFLYSDYTCIRYHHVRGVTRGMDVEWRLTARGTKVDVTIIHALVPGHSLPGVSGRAGRFLVGELFVRNIAQQTLRGIKAAAERNL
jgi:hypothetical protein